MQLIQEQDSITVSTENYRLIFPSKRPYVSLNMPEGDVCVELFVLSSIHTINGRDDTIDFGEWQIDDTGREIVLTIQAQSSLWEKKIYRFYCSPRRFIYEMEVAGQGDLAEVHYFGGYHSSQTRWGSGFFISGQRFSNGFNPEPNSDEINFFGPAENTVIDLLGVPLPGKGHWFFTPPPFCYAFETPSGWLGMGVEANPGGYRFTEYAYHGQRGGFHLSLSYEGHTHVSGTYTLPRIGFDFAGSAYEALAAHVCALHETGMGVRPEPEIRPTWWYEPIFCGWGAQCSLATRDHGNAPDYSRQEFYQSFLETLDQSAVWPGIVVLDDKWQQTYGENIVDPEKFPDLPGFIHQQHELGRKVLLWLKAWDPEGLPAEECITNAAGRALAVDPSNPAYENRLRESIRRMLSPEGYHADGFKIDFTARIPSGPGMHTYGDTWGLELLRRYLEIVYTEAKRVKPDALVMTHTPHPYLSDVLDMIRLNDINRHTDVGEAMQLRAKVASIACPQAIIDTDNWPMTDKATWRSYLTLQPDLGIPSLYFATAVDSTHESLDAEDYQLIREVWTRHRARL